MKRREPSGLVTHPHRSQQPLHLEGLENTGGRTSTCNTITGVPRMLVARHPKKLLFRNPDLLKGEKCLFPCATKVAYGCLLVLVWLTQITLRIPGCDNHETATTIRQRQIDSRIISSKRASERLKTGQNQVQRLLISCECQTDPLHWLSLVR